MKVFYDFHIHSCLSPCGDNENTPCMIVGMSQIKGLQMIAISDHNHIGNVKTAIDVGNSFGVVVVPSIEVQTSEDIHVVAMFKTFEDLNRFYLSLNFQYIENNERIFGEQLIVDEDDQIIAKEDRLLLTSSDIGIYQLIGIVKEFGGISFPAHIDREANGIIAILGDVPLDLGIQIVEFSHNANNEIKSKYKNFIQLTDSDAHYLTDISEATNCLELPDVSIEALFKHLNGGI